MRSRLNLWLVALNIFELGILIVLPLPIWAKVLIYLGLSAIMIFAPLAYYFLATAAWIWGYIYIWMNPADNVLNIFGIVLLAILCIKVLITMLVISRADIMHRPMSSYHESFWVVRWFVVAISATAAMVLLVRLVA